MTARELARALLDHFRGDALRWTKGAAARAALHVPCMADSVGAICWCLSGAVERIAFRSNPPPVLAEQLDGLDDAARKLGFHDCGDMISWNDAPQRTFMDVQALLESIASGESRS